MTILDKPRTPATAILFTALLGLFFVTPGGAQTIAPRNPALAIYLQKAAAGQAPRYTSDGHPLGLMPPSVDMSFNTGRAVGTGMRAQSDSYPSSYDLRATGRVTPVGNQGSCGDCWAFATYSSLESNMMPAQEWDFSENNLKDLSGYVFAGLDCCTAGGNALMSTAYLARWSGPVAEADDPENQSSLRFVHGAAGARARSGSALPTG